MLNQNRLGASSHRHLLAGPASGHQRLGTSCRRSRSQNISSSVSDISSPVHSLLHLSSLLLHQLLSLASLTPHSSSFHLHSSPVSLSSQVLSQTHGLSIRGFSAIRCLIGPPVPYLLWYPVRSRARISASTQVSLSVVVSHSQIY